MAQSIKVTYKNNDEEINMYMDAMNHAGQAAYMKDCQKFYMTYGHLEKKLKQLLQDENK